MHGQKQASPQPNSPLSTSNKSMRVVNEHANAIQVETTQPVIASLRRPMRSENRPVTSASTAYTPIHTPPSQPSADALAPNSAARRLMVNVTPATLMSIKSAARYKM